MILLHMGFSDFVYYKDTMFDVNLVKKKNSDYSLIITDILLKRGERMDKGVVERYSSIIDLLNNEYIEYLDIQQFSLECTPIYNHKDINVILDEHINSYDYKINGLYIHNGNYTYIHILPRYNDRCTTIDQPVEDKQNKKKEDKPMLDKGNTINNADLKDKDIVLQIRITDLPDIYHLYAGNDEYVGIANIPSLKCSKMIKKLLYENDHSYMECKYNYQFNKWEPVQYSDKPLTTIEIVNQITKLQE